MIRVDVNLVGRLSGPETLDAFYKAVGVHEVGVVAEVGPYLDDSTVDVAPQPALVVGAGVCAEQGKVGHIAAGESGQSTLNDGVDLGGNNCVMPIEDAIHLRRIDPGRNMARFYRLSSMPSLFGDVCVVREWGRIGRRGRTRIDLYAREAEAAAARLVLELAKRRRGYRDAPGIE